MIPLLNVCSTNGIQQMGDIDSLSSLWPTNKPEPANTNVEQLLAQMHDLSFMLKDELSVPDKPIDHSKPWSGNNKNCVLLLSAKEDRCWKFNIFGAGRIAPNIPEWKMQVKSQKTLFQQRAFYQSIGQQRIVFVFSVASLHWSSESGWFLDCPWVRLRIMFLSASSCMYHFAACKMYRVELSSPINEFRFRLFMHISSFLLLGCLVCNILLQYLVVFCRWYLVGFQ